MKILIIVLCLSTINIFAEDIHLKDGKIYKNVLIAKSTKVIVSFKFDGEDVVISRNDIIKIDPVAYDSTKQSVLTIDESNLSSGLTSVKKTKPYAYFFLIGLVSGGFSWNYFSEASDLGKVITVADKIGVSSESASNTQTQKYVLGALFAGVAVACFIISTTTVEVKVNSNSVSLSYNF